MSNQSHFFADQQTYKDMAINMKHHGGIRSTLVICPWIENSCIFYFRDYEFSLIYRLVLKKLEMNSNCLLSTF